MHEQHTKAPADTFWQRNIIGIPCEGKGRCARCRRRAARYRFFKLSAAVPFDFQWDDKSLCLACADHVGRCGLASGQAFHRFSMSRHHLRSLRGPAHDVYSVDYDHFTMDRETGDQEWYSVVVLHEVGDAWVSIREGCSPRGCAGEGVMLPPVTG